MTTSYSHSMVGQRGLISYSLSSPLSNQQRNESSRQDTTNSSRRPMSGRELKRLRLKRSAIISRQRLHRGPSSQAEDVWRIPEDDVGLFQHRSHNRAIENIYMDLAVEDIYKEIHDEGIFFVFEDNDSSVAEGSSGTSATANSSSIDQDHELFVTEVPSPTPSSAPHEIETVNIDEIMKNNQESGKSNGNTEIENRRANTEAVICSFIDFDMLQADNDDNFDQILKDFEDQRTKKFISEETNCSHTHDNELHSNPVRQIGVHDAASVHTSRSIDTFGFSKHDHIARDISKSTSSKASASQRSITSDKTPSTLNSFQCPTQPKSPQSNSFGRATKETSSSNANARANSTTVAEISSPSSFRRRMQKLKENLDSLSNIDSFGFLDDDVDPPISAPIVKFPSDNDLPISSTGDSSSQKDTKPKVGMRHEGHDIADDNRSVTSSVKYTKSFMMLSRARRLRTLRLRAAADNQNREGDSGYKVEPFHISGTAEGEQMRPESPDTALAFADYSGQIIRVKSNEERDISCQSVISEISTQSERLLIKMSPKLEDIMDDMNSFCGGIVIPDEGSCNSEDEYDKQMEYEESKGKNVEEPPYDFDASVKTPPRRYLDPKFQAVHKRKQVARIFRKPCSGPLEWDDVSSVGLLVVDAETNNQIPKLRKNISSNRQARVSGISSCQRYSVHSISTDEKEKQKLGIFRKLLCIVDDTEDDVRSEASPTFSTLWGDGHSNAKAKPKRKEEKHKGKHDNADSPELAINHTFSTEEDDFASYCTGNSEEEIQNLEKNIFRSKDKATLSWNADDNKSRPRAGRIVYSC
eukprot:CAMPEP_0116117338 /NCGR_PEP_ID=MMETSP0329-20121206/1516_1 /TAXON_ID=697910 /ORGANISM="Pseudo-nitzschia arenysensis, Strain B593" /LENGTH=810 /DNA_ID=CAMNT_0003610889 /DNA_START=159 /DNA_END=2591 /DNA_ORIENTATION=+